MMYILHSSVNHKRNLQLYSYQLWMHCVVKYWVEGRKYKKESREIYVLEVKQPGMRTKLKRYNLFVCKFPRLYCNQHSYWIMIIILSSSPEWEPEVGWVQISQVRRACRGSCIVMAITGGGAGCFTRFPLISTQLHLHQQQYRQHQQYHGHQQHHQHQ